MPLFDVASSITVINVLLLLLAHFVGCSPILPAHLMLKPSNGDSQVSRQQLHTLPIQPSLTNDIPPPVRLPSENRVMPKPRDMNETKLRRLLGKDFNSAYMSLFAPAGVQIDLDATTKNTSSSIFPSRKDATQKGNGGGTSRIRNKMPLEIRSLQFQVPGLPHRARTIMESRETRRALRLFLWGLQHMSRTISVAGPGQFLLAALD